MRDGKTSEFKATLSENADAKIAGRDSEDREGEGSAKYGMTVEPLTPEIARQLELDRDVKGVVISGVEPSGAAASAGLREGDVIQQVNGKPVRTAEEVRGALNATSGKPAVLLVARGNNTIFVPLRGK
jgi:serine protease Do